MRKKVREPFMGRYNKIIRSDIFNCFIMMIFIRFSKLGQAIFFF